MKIKVRNTIKIRKKSKSRNQIHRGGRRGTRRNMVSSSAFPRVPCGEHYVGLPGPRGSAISCYTVIA